jgi:hypothetical protein
VTGHVQWLKKHSFVGGTIEKAIKGNQKIYVKKMTNWMAE